MRKNNTKATGQNDYIQGEIIRAERVPGSFAIIGKSYAEDERLSDKAVGIMTRLLIKPDNWKVNVKYLVNTSANGRDSKYSGLKELEKYGYYKKFPVRDEKGRVLYWKSVICEYSTEEQQSESQTKAKKKPTTAKNSEKTPILSASYPLTDFPDVDKPDMAEPDVVFPHLENPDRNKNQITENKDNIELEVPISARENFEPAAPPIDASQNFSPAFESNQSNQPEFEKFTKTTGTASPDLTDLTQNPVNFEKTAELRSAEEIADKVELTALKAEYPDYHTELDVMHTVICNVLANGEQPSKLRVKKQPIELHRDRPIFALLAKEHLASVMDAYIKRNDRLEKIRNAENYFATSLHDAAQNPKIRITPVKTKTDAENPGRKCPIGFNEKDFFDKIAREERKLLEDCDDAAEISADDDWLADVF